MPRVYPGRRCITSYPDPPNRTSEDSMTLDEIAALEQQWVGRVQVSARDRYFDWQPAPVGMFNSLLEECLPYVPLHNLTFLDAGGGIGTKCLLAQRYGLIAHNIDRVSEYISEACRLGVDSELSLIEDYVAISEYGIVYVNHPLVPDFEEVVIERDIHDRMGFGSVLMSINYDVAPSGWTEVARIGPWNAAWVKS
jgi:hypothetical protein